jgi:hypothetical protein
MGARLLRDGNKAAELPIFEE